MSARRKQSIQRSLPGMDGPEIEECEVAPSHSPSEMGTGSEQFDEWRARNADHEAPVPLLQPNPAPAPPDSLAGKTVWVVDANSLIFQVFHALPEMTSPAGMPVSAVFGFARDMLFILEQKKPDYLFVAFDRSEPTFRHELFADYKGKRAEMPVDLAPQFPAIYRLLGALGVPVVDCPGYEADDILATIAEQTDLSGGECFLVTGDKDCRQLISDRVCVYNIRKNQSIDAAALAADWTIRPEQVVDFQTLVGDPVDNIPGVPLVGPKVAAEWLGKFGTLERILESVEQLPKGKRRDNLLASREQLPISRRLVQLDRHVPVAIDWAAARPGRANRDALLALFAEFGFHGFARKLDDLTIPLAPPAWQADYRTVATPAELADFVVKLAGQSEVSLDTETTHIWPRWAELVGLSFAWADGEAYYLPVQAPFGELCLDREAALAELRPHLENPRLRKIGQNLKYDWIVLRGCGIELAGVDFDTMIASYLLDAGERNHNLDELSHRYLRHETIKIGELIGTGKNQKRMDEVPVAQITQYAAEDADVAWRLRAPLAKRLAESDLEKLFATLEMPLVEVLVELEWNGIKVDVQRLAELSAVYGGRMAIAEREIYELAGHEFNIGSPKQLQQVLFDEQKLPMIRRVKTGGSTDADVLEELARVHPLPAKIMEYRQYAKLKGTYVDALPRLVHPTTGRVHTSFNQTVAATGRLSSHDPNLQNIPVRTQAGREIRSAFLPGEPGWKLLAADYSQIELRVLAHFSGDEALCAAFARDEDIHASVASQVNRVPLAAVTPEMRRSAKAVNFGVIYGQSPFGLAKQLGIDQEEAAAFIEQYFARYAGVDRFLTSVLERCAETGYASTILGRRRAIEGVRPDSIRPESGRQRNLPERTAINTVVQGSAADLIKLAMLAIARRLQTEQLRARMLLQIHDELIFEVPPDEVSRLAALVSDLMSHVLPLGIPLKVDVKTGDNWADVEPWQ